MLTLFTDDEDYNVNHRVLSFFSQRTECIMVTINNDVILEEEEYISLMLQPASNTAPFIAVLPQQTIINIQDNDGTNAILLLGILITNA